EHRPALAVGAPAGTTRAARAAYGVDLTDDAPAHERRGSLLDDADELVARDSGERVVPARQLEVGVADAGAEHTHERLAGRRFGDRNVGRARRRRSSSQRARMPGNMPWPASLTESRASW